MAGQTVPGYQEEQRLGSTRVVFHNVCPVLFLTNKKRDQVQKLWFLVHVRLFLNNKNSDHVKKLLFVSLFKE
jgi:hypothetical protein